MFKKTVKLLSLIFIPIAISSLALFVYSNFLDSQIESLYNPALARTYGIDEMGKGIKILEHNAAQDDLIILGSSELDSWVPQNAKNMFPNKELNCNVDLVGRAIVQNFANSIKVGALQKSFEGKKIVLLVSLQWFLDKDVDLNGFKSNFSEIQFYKFMNSDKISHQNKIYACERISELLKNDPAFERPYLYATLYKKNNILSNATLTCFKPYYFVREKFLELKDKYQAYKTVNDFKNEPFRDSVDINWKKEEVKAQKMGEEYCTNNKFYVQDEYYDEYLKDRIAASKNSYDPNLDLCASKEFDDYKLMLETFKESGISPYLIFVSTNGFYYDYVGLDRDKRISFYDKLCNMADEYNFDYLDLRDKEYEPYFYKDVMHLGWKGWLYVNKQITKHYS